jgi:hypothetical protein
MLKLKAQLEDELEVITQRMARLDSHRALVQIPPGASVRTVWESADLELKRSLIGLLVEKIIVLPGRFGSKRWKDDTTGQEYNFDPAGVEIVWRA